MTHRTVTADEFLALVRSQWSEAEFTQAVLDLAQSHGWRRAHFRPARTAKGWRTAMSGDPGFPDLVLVRGRAVLFAELKVGRNKPTAEQQAWLDALDQTRALVFLWTPDDWSKIQEVLFQGKEL